MAAVNATAELPEPAHALAAAAPTTDTPHAIAAALPSLVTALRSCSKELQGQPQLVQQIMTDDELLPRLVQSIGWILSPADTTCQEVQPVTELSPAPSPQSHSSPHSAGAGGGPPAESLPPQAAAVFWAAEVLSLGASLSGELAQAALSHGVLAAVAQALSRAAASSSAEKHLSFLAHYVQHT
eukprot:gene10848-16965_t